MKKLIALLLLCGCATPGLTAAGRNVKPVAAAPSPECEVLGQVIGQGGGVGGGAFIANDQLVQYAMNDAYNKAAALGATHIQPAPALLGQGDGTTTTATVTALAYRCPTIAVR